MSVSDKLINCELTLSVDYKLPNLYLPVLNSPFYYPMTLFQPFDFCLDFGKK